MTLLPEEAGILFGLIETLQTALNDSVALAVGTFQGPHPDRASLFAALGRLDELVDQWLDENAPRPEAPPDL